ncbi:unnamed protein product [Arabidopsis halleri]
MRAFKAAKKVGCSVIPSHEGKFFDNFIHDFSVGLSCDQIKTRVLSPAKYQRIIYMEDQLGKDLGMYAGFSFRNHVLFPYFRILNQLAAESVFLCDLENNNVPYDFDLANTYTLMKSCLEIEGFTGPLTVYVVCTNDVLTQGGVVIDGSLLKEISFHRIQGCK